MTQINEKAPEREPLQGDHEEFQVMGEDLVATVKRLLHESNVRRIIIKHEDHIVIEIPLTVGLIGTLLVPWLAAIGAIGTVLTHCTVEVERTERADDPPMD